MPDLAPAAARAAHEQRAPPRIEVALAAVSEPVLEAHPDAPEHEDERPQASAVAIIVG